MSPPSPCIFGFSTIPFYTGREEFTTNGNEEKHMKGV
jgi:hypothetical protein